MKTAASSGYYLWMTEGFLLVFLNPSPVGLSLEPEFPLCDTYVVPGFLTWSGSPACSISYI